MKKAFRTRTVLPLATALLAHPLFAQDTTTVQTFTYDSLAPRRGWWTFPPTDQTARKVWMVQTMKCGTTGEAGLPPCASAPEVRSITVHHRTGALDSIAFPHALFLVGTERPDSAALFPSPLADRYQRFAQVRVIDQEVSELDHYIGSGSLTDAGAYQDRSRGARTQFLLRSDELQAAGVDRVDAIRLLATNNSSPLHRLVVRLKNRPTAPLLGSDGTELVTVLDQPYQFQQGVNTLELLGPFHWAGPGNDLLVDLIMERTVLDPPAAGPVLSAGPVGEGVAIRAEREGHLALAGGLLALSAAPFAPLDQQVTVMFRSRTNTLATEGSTILEAVDVAGNSVLRIELPSSDGEIRWTTGNGGAGSIHQSIGASELEGPWNHWAFVKDATSGTMRILLNGALFHSGTDLYDDITGISSVVFGSAHDRTLPFVGDVDDLFIFGTALDDATIEAWADRTITPQHPAYANLLYGHAFNDITTSGTSYNMASNGAASWLLGRYTLVRSALADAPRSWTPLTTRPNLLLVSQEHLGHIDTIVVEDPVLLQATALELFEVSGHTIVAGDTIRGWESPYQVRFAPDGTALDSVLSNTSAFLRNSTITAYGEPFPVVQDVELGRGMTPFSELVDLGAEGFEWIHDVTDLQVLLHDSVEISINDAAPLVDLRFMLIAGTPPRSLLGLQQPWGPTGPQSYLRLAQDEAFPPVSIVPAAGADQWYLQTRITGHGQAGVPDGEQTCCEVHDNTFQLYVNGLQVAGWNIWTNDDCALNPLYPQGDDWPLARSGWCPGAPVRERQFDLTAHLTSSPFELDLDITPLPVEDPDLGGGTYLIGADLLEFGPPNHALDAELLHVVRPSLQHAFRRENPLCDGPIVVLRNSGAETLTSVTFQYGVSGGNLETFLWEGSLQFMDTVRVALPVTTMDFWSGDQQHLFTVELQAPNNQLDQYPANDRYHSPFMPPVVYPANFIVQFTTNERPEENAWKLYDRWDQVVMERTTLSAATDHFDTLSLPAGCYTLVLTDSGNDGIAYPYAPEAGFGLFRFLSMEGAPIQGFDGNFGHSIRWPFTIESGVALAEHGPTLRLWASPNPGDGLFTIHGTGEQGKVDIEVRDLQGRTVRAMGPVGQEGGIRHLDLRHQPAGIYLARIRTEDGSGVLRLIKH